MNINLICEVNQYFSFLDVAIDDADIYEWRDNGIVTTFYRNQPIAIKTVYKTTRSSLTQVGLWIILIMGLKNISVNNECDILNCK